VLPTAAAAAAAVHDDDNDSELNDDNKDTLKSIAKEDISFINHDDSQYYQHEQQQKQQHVPLAQRRSSRTMLSDISRWGGRYALSQSKLFIIIHDIGGELLNNSIAQHCLSILASCSSVSIIATLDNINSTILWNKQDVAHYNWIMDEISTYKHYSIPESSILVNNELFSTSSSSSSAIVDKLNGRTDYENDDGDDYDNNKNENENNKNISRGIKNNYNNNKTNNNDISDNDNKRGNEMSKDTAIASLNAVLRSLTPNHRSLFKRFWEEFLKYENQENNYENKINNNRRMNIRESNRNFGSVGNDNGYNNDNDGCSSTRSHNTRASSSSSNRNDFININNKYGIKFDTLLSSLKEQLIVKNEKDLKVLLKEFIDHHLIVLTTFNNLPYICFKIPKDVMLKYYKAIN